MCNLSKEVPKFKEFTGYKLVMRDRQTGDFHSTFTGQKYTKGWLPKIRKALPVSKWAVLDESAGFFREAMVGRTFVFVNLADAMELGREKRPYPGIKERFDFVVARATVTGKLLRGTYNSGDGYAGRRIHFERVVRIMEEDEVQISANSTYFPSEVKKIGENIQQLVGKA